MPAPKREHRNYVRYQLKDRNKVVYRGITNDPDRRYKEHQHDKQFTSMEIIGPRVTEESARKWEQESLETYKRNQGELPKYNCR